METVAGIAGDSYWASLARAYAQLGPPLRPSDEDIRFLERTVAEYARGQSGRAIQALLLGVTPDLAGMRWPAACRLLAVDSSFPMVRAVWPGDVPGRRRAVCGDWLAMPLRESSCDILVGDGSMNCVKYPEECRAFARSARAAVKPGGILILRCYAQPEVQDGPEKVLEDALGGKIPTFTQFKFRLLMAMQHSAREGIAVNEVYRFWARRKAVESLLVERTGWRRSEIDTIELYRGVATVHTFPTLAESRRALSEFFDEVTVSFPTYFDGERCPRLVMTPKRGKR